MNSSYPTWGEPKDPKKSLEEQIDPSFSRQQDDFPSVDEVAAAVSVAASASEDAVHAQQVQQLQQQAAQQLQQHSQNQLHQQQLSQQAANDLDAMDDDEKQEMLARNGRPLTNTKRAAQNRNAQRAFRQRKELYIKDLEQQVHDVKGLKETIETLVQENVQLRDYIMVLQSRILENPDIAIPTPPAVFSTRPSSSAHDLSGMYKTKKK